MTVTDLNKVQQQRTRELTQSAPEMIEHVYKMIQKLESAYRMLPPEVAQHPTLLRAHNAAGSWLLPAYLGGHPFERSASLLQDLPARN